MRSSSSAASISRSISWPVLAVDFQSMRLSGSPGTCGRMPRNSPGVAGRQPAPSAAATSAAFGADGARGEILEPRHDSDAQRLACGPMDADQTQRVFHERLERRQMVDSATGRPRPGGDRPVGLQPESLDHHGIGGPAPEAAGGAGQGDAQTRKPATASHPERHLQKVAVDGLLWVDAPVDLKPARTGDRSPPGDASHRGERQRDQVELPGAEHPRRPVGGDGDREERDAPRRWADHRPGPGAGTASRSRVITASSACARPPPRLRG